MYAGMLVYFLSDALLIPIGGLFLQEPAFLGPTGSWKIFSVIKFFLDCLCFPVVYTVLWLILLLDFT